jgi:hypothetical protein
MGKKKAKKKNGKKSKVSTVDARPNPGATKKAYDKEVKKHSKGRKTLEDIANQPTTTRGQIKAQLRGVGHKLRYMADSVVYAVPTAINNYRSARAIRKNPNMPAMYIVKGVSNLKSHQYRKAKFARKAGYAPVITKTKHSEHSDSKKYKLFKEQVKSFQKRARIKNAKNRADIALGHSSGGNDVLYAAHQKDVVDLIGQYGGVQASAHDYYGMELENLEQKAFGAVLDMSNEDVGKSPEARKIALKRMRQGRAYVDIETVAFSQDMLVPAKNVYHPHASKLHVVDHPSADHFAGSGSHDPSASILIDLGDKQRKKNLKKRGEANSAANYNLDLAA